MIKLAVLVLLLAANANASALADTYLTIPFASYHLDRHRGYNEENHGIGFEHALTPDFRLAAGTFQNSIRRASNYAGAVYAPLELGPVRAGASFGLISGYAKHSLLMLAPVVMVEGTNLGLNIIIVPPMDHGKVKTSGVLGFQLKWKLD